MACDWVKVRAPGSVMLFGEHAVLAAQPAMVAAIAQYLTVTLKKREDSVIAISSNTFPLYETSLQALTVVKPYTFVLACLAQHQAILTHGLHIHIDSAIDPTLGLGSSAAVTVAVLTALKHLFDLDIAIWPHACAIIQQIQGSGSGMDALASLEGGALYYVSNNQPPLSLSPRTDLHLLYCGYKTPTADVLQQVRRAFSKADRVLQAIYQAIGSTVQQAAAAWQQNDTASLAQCMRIHQGLQKALQVSDDHSERLCQWLKDRVAVAAVKLSGAGLGDCLLALGGDWSRITQDEIHSLHPHARYIPLNISPVGVSLVD